MSNMNDRIQQLLGLDEYIYTTTIRAHTEAFIESFHSIGLEPDPYRDNMDVSLSPSTRPYKLAIYNFTKLLDPTVIVELGVREGNSSDAFTRNLIRQGRGKLYSFDPSGEERLHKHMFHAASEEYWEFHPMLGEDGFEQFKNTVTNIDLLYIDTDPHSYEQMQMWLKSYWIQNVRPGGYIMFDDCAPQHQKEVVEVPTNIFNVGANYGVLRAVLEYVDTSSDVEWAISVCNVKSNGVGLIKLKDRG